MGLKYDERIEPYLTGQMSNPEELRAFEAEMEADKELKASVDFYREAAFSAERLHDKEIIRKEAAKPRYTFQNLWFRFQRLFYRARLVVVSAITAFMLALSGLGALIATAAQTAQKLFSAGAPYVTQLALAVSRDADDAFERVDSALNGAAESISGKDFKEAQIQLNSARSELKRLASDNALYQDDIRERSDLIDFSQAILWSQNGKGLKAKKLLTKIATDKAHLYSRQAADILSK